MVHPTGQCLRRKLELVEAGNQTGAMMLVRSCLVFLALPAWCQEPKITSFQPYAIAPGKVSEIRLSGNDLAPILDVWTSFPAKVSASNEMIRFDLDSGIPTGVGAFQIASAKGLSAIQLIMVDDLSSIGEARSNSTAAATQRITPPIAVDGACNELALDFYRFAARKGQKLSIETVAQRLGSSADTVLRVLDIKGRELAFCDDGGVWRDSRFEFKAPASGDYILELRDMNYAGGDGYAYRLRVGDFPLSLPQDLTGPLESEPNDTIETASPIARSVMGRFERDQDRDLFRFEAQKGERHLFAATTRGLDSPCDAMMRILKADGSRLAEANVSSGDEGTITNTFKEGGTYFLELQELTGKGSPDFVYRVEAKPLKPGFTLSTENDRFDHKDGVLTLKVTCTRRDYAGPITLALADHSDWFHLENRVLEEKKNETVLKLKPTDACPKGKILPLQLIGTGEKDGKEISERVSTLPPLRKNFPRMTTFPPDLEGVISALVP